MSVFHGESNIKPWSFCNDNKNMIRKKSIIVPEISLSEFKEKVREAGLVSTYDFFIKFETLKSGIPLALFESDGTSKTIPYLYCFYWALWKYN